MKINKLFRSFKVRLLWEGLLKAFLFALMLGAAAVFLTSLVYHILVLPAPFSVLAVAGGSVFAFGFLLVFAVSYYPTQKRIAARIDETGLQERVSTMLQYRKENTCIAQLQRKDALEKLGKTSPREIKFSIGKRELICCAVSLCLAFVMLMLPYNILSFGVSADQISREQEKIVQELIEKLREDVRNAALEEEIKEELNAILDKMEEELEEAESELEKVAIIEEAKEEMEELLEEEITRVPIGKALQQYDITKELGLALENGETEEVSVSLDEMEKQLNEDKELLSQLVQDIWSALQDSQVDPEDALYIALAEYAAALEKIDPESESFSEELKEATDAAESAILKALEEQAQIQAEKESMEESMSEVKEKILEDKEESEESETATGEPKTGETEKEGGKGEKTEGENQTSEEPGKGERPQGQGGENSNGVGSEISDEEKQTMIEGIFDPVAGSVPYGEVFAAYYAQYLDAVENGRIPEEIREILDRYYSSLE